MEAKKKIYERERMRPIQKLEQAKINVKFLFQSRSSHKIEEGAAAKI